VRINSNTRAPLVVLYDNVGSVVYGP